MQKIQIFDKTGISQVLHTCCSQTTCITSNIIGKNYAAHTSLSRTALTHQQNLKSIEYSLYVKLTHTHVRARSHEHLLTNGTN